MDVYQRLLRTFVKDLHDMPGQLQKHVDQGESLLASRVLHTLKGLAATLGALALSAEAARGEQRLAAGAALDEAAAAAQQACAAIRVASPPLATLLQTLQEAHATAAALAPTATDRSPLVPLLRAMSEHLHNHDMAATDAMRELQRQFGAVLAEQLGPLDEAVNALDFGTALRLCESLIEAQAA
jgi:HPt (histidine-containing phosphotransfer) domain-containing protein